MTSPPLRVLLADDEALARSLLRRHVSAHPDLRIVGECASGDALAAALEGDTPDLVLLDIRMPGRDVFDVLGEASSRGALPWVVFTTAYDRYAIRAFEVNAVDYLVKPFAEERFAAAIDRVRDRLRARSGPGAAALERLIRDLGRRPERLLVPERGRMVSVQVADIDFVKAEGDYARLYSQGKSYLVSRSLADLEERLDPERFLRIHRSVIVNAARIREVRPEGSSRYTVVLGDGTPLLVSRTRAAQLRRFML